MISVLGLLYSLTATAGVLIYQGASASLSSTTSLVTYTTAMPPLAQPQQVYYVNSQTFGSVTPDISDPGYKSGIYTCSTQGTYSVGASLAITGTIAALSYLKLGIELSSDSGTTWTPLRTVPVSLPMSTALSNAGLGSAYVAFVVPCPAGGQIRVTASTNVVLPVLSTTPSDNALTILKLF